MSDIWEDIETALGIYCPDNFCANQMANAPVFAQGMEFFLERAGGDGDFNELPLMDTKGTLESVITPDRTSRV